MSPIFYVAGGLGGGVAAEVTRDDAAGALLAHLLREPIQLQLLLRKLTLRLLQHLAWTRTAGTAVRRVSQSQGR